MQAPGTRDCEIVARPQETEIHETRSLGLIYGLDKVVSMGLDQLSCCALRVGK